METIQQPSQASPARQVFQLVPPRMHLATARTGRNREKKSRIHGTIDIGSTNPITPIKKKHTYAPLCDHQSVFRQLFIVTECRTAIIAPVCGA
jgi:hypothetical protein